MRPMDRLYGDWEDGSSWSMFEWTAVHLAVTNLAVWWIESGKMVHTRREISQRQVQIGFDLAVLARFVLDLEVHRKGAPQTLVLTGDL
jgi:hypothetical protein